MRATRRGLGFLSKGATACIPHPFFVGLYLCRSITLARLRQRALIFLSKAGRFEKLSQFEAFEPRLVHSLRRNT